jgi:hypothetical protein
MPSFEVEIVGRRSDGAPATGGEGASGALRLWTATLAGEPLPRGAAREIAFVRGVPRMVATQRARLWQRSALAQLLNRRPPRPLSGMLALECRFWHGATNGAADDSDVTEILERAAVIASRRQIREKHIFAGRDETRPRIEIALRRVYRA